MMRPSLRLGTFAVVLAAAAVFTTACSSSPEPEASVSSPAPSSTAEVPKPEASVEPSQEPAASPECETLISTVTIADFEAVGWTSQEEVFRVGALEIPDGIQCRWGDFSMASDHLQIFGWAPISDTEAEAAQAELLASGWLDEEADGTLYITESPDTALSVDEEGYGLTYQFGDGWVKMADTKQGLLLIEWPPS